jgi:nucleoside-diphosphate-sugar epimerase
MKVLITGSSGFIGRALVQKLRDSDCEVAGLDKLPADETRYVCDILDAPRVLKIVEEFAPDALVHLAARIDIDEKADLSGYAANIDGVRNTLAAVRSTPSIKRAIWTSSQLVCRVDYTPKSDTDYNADTLYGESKILTERIVREEDGASREWCIVRPTTVWGPGMSSHYQRFLQLIKSGFYFHIGSSPRLKSYSYIGNLTYQYHQLLRAPAGAIHGKMFYLADYEPLDLIAWGDAFQRAFHARRIPRVPISVARALAFCGDTITAVGLTGFPFNSRRLKNILTEYQFDLTAAKAVCGPLPRTIEQGVQETVDWFNSVSSPTG